MARMLALVLASAVGCGLAGCASTWDTISSKRFREKPWASTFGTEDPMQVLRTSPDGEERAAAMRRLKEPLADGKSQAEQDEAFQILAEAATSDPSPWVRMAAIDALGKFRDPRAVETLATAYHQASGRPAGSQPAPAIQPVAGRSPSPLADRLGLHGPQGFPADQAANIRGRALDALAATGHPQAIEFLAHIADGQEVPLHEDPSALLFVRQRAVAGLGKIRRKESVAALARVLAAEEGKDITLTNLAHEGLVDLTGKSLPPKAEEWDRVVQAGFELAPEPNPIQRAIGFRPE